MSTPFYNALIPLSQNSDFTIESFVSKLVGRLPEYRVSAEDNRVTVAQDDWSLTVDLSNDESDDKWVNEEANEIADMNPEWPNIEQLRDSTSRLELFSYSDDSDMDHYNTYLFILEEIDEFSGVLFKFDPRDGGLI